MQPVPTWSTGFVNLSRLQVSCRRWWQVPGWRDRFNGRVSSSYGSSWRRRLGDRQRQLFAIIILIITWHPSAFGNQSARLSRVAIAGWPPSLLHFSPSRFIASRGSMSLISKTGAGWHRWIHLMGVDFSGDIIAWVCMPRYPYMPL
jgi:hypothetical protein